MWDGRIEWKNFRKAPPIYVGPNSCHDPMVKSAIVKGVGQRLRINSSKVEYFDESVEDAARAFKMSGYNYQKTKQELMKFRDLDPIQLINKEKVVKKGPDKGVQAYFISTFDPRMMHPRQLITRNYHFISSNPVLSELFPRENLVGGTRRLKNLQEMLSPTVQTGVPPGNNDDDDGDEDQNDDDAGGGGRHNGSYHCRSFKERRKCDVCSYMIETSFVTSYYFNRRFAIHGRNVHLPSSMKNKTTWFVYLAHDTHCQLLYVGSTTDVCSRWSNTKSACLNRNKSNTGLYKHFQQGCPEHITSGNVKHLTWTLLDHYNTTQERLSAADHIGGPSCICRECQNLKDVEDKWICRLGSFHPPHGLNTRDEIKARSRVNYRHNGI